MSAKSKRDSVVYTVLMSIALAAMALSCVLLHYDLARYPTIVP
jgi:hypothetical protein